MSAWVVLDCRCRFFANVTQIGYYQFILQKSWTNVRCFSSEHRTKTMFTLTTSLQMRHFLTLSMHSWQLKLCLHGSTIVFDGFVEQISHSEFKYSSTDIIQNRPLLIGGRRSLARLAPKIPLLFFVWTFELVATSLLYPGSGELELDRDFIRLAFGTAGSWIRGSHDAKITLRFTSIHKLDGVSLF